MTSRRSTGMQTDRGSPISSSTNRCHIRFVSANAAVRFERHLTVDRVNFLDVEICVCLNLIISGTAKGHLYDAGVYVRPVNNHSNPQCLMMPIFVHVP